MPNFKLQAKHLPDLSMLTTIAAISAAKKDENYGSDVSPWVLIWELERVMPHVPEKVIRAKMKSLLRRGLIEGCSCGCRGDYYILPKGYAYLQQTLAGFSRRKRRR